MTTTYTCRNAGGALPDVAVGAGVGAGVGVWPGVAAGDGSGRAMGEAPGLLVELAESLGDADAARSEAEGSAEPCATALLALGEPPAAPVVLGPPGPRRNGDAATTITTAAISTAAPARSRGEIGPVNRGALTSSS